jgi:hypothetical protein
MKESIRKESEHKVKLLYYNLVYEKERKQIVRINNI